MSENALPAQDALAAVDERPGPVRLLVYGIQHLLVMYSSAVTVPVVVASALDLSNTDLVYLVAVDLLLCGIGTLLQSVGIWRVGARLPMVIGASYTGIAPMLVVAQQHDLQTMYGSILIVGVLTVLAAPLVGRAAKHLPPLVVGVVILVIGIHLIPAGAKLITGTNPDAPDFARPLWLGIGAFTVLAVVLAQRFLPAVLKPVAVLLGMVAGFVLALLLGQVSFAGVGEGDPVRVPDITHFGAPSFDLIACLTMTIVQLVLLVEMVGQIGALGDIVGAEASDRQIADAVRADGVVTILGGGVFQSFMYVSFAQNVAILSIIRVFSRWVTATTGVLLTALAFLPVVGQVVAAIPKPVLGGAALVMFGTIVVIGIRVLAEVDFTRAGNITVVAGAIAVALLPDMIPGIYSSMPDAARQVMGSGVSSGLIVALLLHVIFNYQPRRAARPAPVDESVADRPTYV
jgi:uric acid transporter